MIYLDYSATTKINDEVLDTYNKVATKFFANTNSIHNLGKESKKFLNEVIRQMNDIFFSDNIVITSGATEANNLAIKGVLNFYKNRGFKVLITPLEHPSVRDIKDVEFITLKIDSNGRVDLNDLKSKLDLGISLVSICLVDSEIGILQDIKSISEIVRSYPKTKLHIDATQALGKIYFDSSLVDLISISSHKIYGPKGVGALILRNNTNVSPLIEGGSSINEFKGGTISLELVSSFLKAIKLSISNLESNYNRVLELSNYFKDELNLIYGINLNNTKFSIPHIVNFSVVGIKPDTFVNALSTYNIYISTKTACSSKDDFSKSVLSLTNDLDLSKSSVRVSISHLTTKDEIDEVLRVIKLVIKDLGGLNG